MTHRAATPPPHAEAQEGPAGAFLRFSVMYFSSGY